MNRREVLKVLGLGIASPSLFVQQQKIIDRRFEGERIPTGFPELDEATGGGIKPGEVCNIFGGFSRCAIRSIAVKMGRHANVALLKPLAEQFRTKIYEPYEGTVSVFSNDFSTGLWEYLTLTHDVLAWDEGSGLQENFEMMKMARRNQCALLMTVFPWVASTGVVRHSDYVIHIDSLSSSLTLSRPSLPPLISVHSAALIKNRHGNLAFLPLICQNGWFITVEESPHWNYDQLERWNYNQQSDLDAARARAIQLQQYMMRYYESPTP